MNQSTNPIWQIFAELCAIVAIFTMAFLVLALIRWGNTGEYMPVLLTGLFLGVFWFASSWARKNG